MCIFHLQMKLTSTTTSTVLATLTTALLVLSPGVQSHVVQIRQCTKDDGDLRVFFEHWHTWSVGMTTATLNINGDDVEPSGHISNEKIDTLGADCKDGPGSTVKVNPTSCIQDIDDRENNKNNWFYFDLPSDTNYVLNPSDDDATDGTFKEPSRCKDMYPASIQLVPTCEVVGQSFCVLGDDENKYIMCTHAAGGGLAETELSFGLGHKCCTREGPPFPTYATSVASGTSC